jgi:hypothetical protein
MHDPVRVERNPRQYGAGIALGSQLDQEPGLAHLLDGALKRAVKAARIPRPEPSLHDLRHSHASMLIALDVSVVEVQRRLGHRKPDTTLRVYAHQWKEREARRSQIGRQLGRLFAEPKALPAPAAGDPLPALPPAPDPRREAR